MAQTPGFWVMIEIRNLRHARSEFAILLRLLIEVIETKENGPKSGMTSGPGCVEFFRFSRQNEFHRDGDILYRANTPPKSAGVS